MKQNQAIRRRCLCAALVWAALLAPAAPALGQETAATQPSLMCDIGPIVKSYGGAEWLVYSCTDESTVVVVSAPGSPAMPFYFTFYTNDKGYQLAGEGAGSKDVTAAAFEELKTLSKKDFVALIEQTKKK